MKHYHLPAFRLVVLLSLLTVSDRALGQRCGVERWSVKTGTDATAQQLDLSNPKPTTIANLIALCLQPSVISVGV